MKRIEVIKDNERNKASRAISNKRWIETNVSLDWLLMGEESSRAISNKIWIETLSQYDALSIDVVLPEQFPIRDGLKHVYVPFSIGLRNLFQSNFQ
ncbi:hypothetical protein [Runella sp. MFBS21]|uniref:hypothetical protein n=1 Tax=Runella sp. MFBS21 TaxID=3034018 RepID=UPI0038F74209